MNKKICLLAFILSLMGCTQWPPPSTGGYGAHYIFTKSYQSRVNRHSLYLPLSKRLSQVTLEFQALHNGHAKRCYPARFTLLSLLGEQIAQEITRGLFLSADYDLTLFERNLALVYELDKLKGCPRPKPNHNWNFLQSRFL
jgi:hypothetical protein